jgi:hypothetical protein
MVNILTIHFLSYFNLSNIEHSVYKVYVFPIHWKSKMQTLWYIYYTGLLAVNTTLNQVYYQR